MGSAIDWYNVQFYNQGSSAYSTFATLFTASDGWATHSSVFQMVNGDNDIAVKTPADMIVVGKPVNSGDADNTGYVPAATLQSIFAKAIESGDGNGAVW